MTAPVPRILLVEDNEDDVFFMERALKSADIANPLQVARDGQKALDYLKGSGKFADRELYPLPFIAFIDLKLPYVSGFELLEWMRGEPSMSPVVPVVLTSSNEDRDHQKAYSLGARSYLVKPPSGENLVMLMDSLESFWSREKEQGPIVRSKR